MENLSKDQRIEEISQRELTPDSDSIINFIAELKAAGASLIQTMKIVKIKLDIDLGQASEIVLNSDSWNDHKENFYQFNNWMIGKWAKNADEVTEEGNKVTLKFNLKDDEEEQNN